MASSGYCSSLRSPSQKVSLILLHGVTDFAAICNPVPGKKVNHCPLHLIKGDQKPNDHVTKTFSKHQFWFWATLDEIKWAYGFRNR